MPSNGPSIVRVTMPSMRKFVQLDWEGAEPQPDFTVDEITAEIDRYMERDVDTRLKGLWQDGTRILCHVGKGDTIRAVCTDATTVPQSLRSQFATPEALVRTVFESWSDVDYPLYLSMFLIP